MKKLINKSLLFLCVLTASLNAKQLDLLTVLFDEEVDEVSIEHITTKESSHFLNNVISLDSNPENDEAEIDDETENEAVMPTVPSPCSLLDLLFVDSDASSLFPDKNEIYYRGQFAFMGLTYIDNSICDVSVPEQIRSARPIDQDKLTAEEKAVVEKYYRLTKQQYESPWYMKFINKKVGYGIYAAADIEAGQLIAEYVGIIYDANTYLSMPRNPKYCWNLLPPLSESNGQKFYVDALSSCNFTRIINHSYKPNVIPVPMHGPDGSRMLYVACEKILKDQQLLVNYGEGYWQTLGQPEDLSR